MPFGLTCEVCERPFTFFENLNFTLRALGRCAECDQRLGTFVENLLTGIEEDFKQPAGITEEIERLVYEEIEKGSCFPPTWRSRSPSDWTTSDSCLAFVREIFLMSCTQGFWIPMSMPIGTSLRPTLTSRARK